jgi:hypothetical protein
VAVNLIDTEGKKKYSYTMAGDQNNEVIRVGQSPKLYTRREALKLAGWSAGGVALEALLSACGVKESELRVPYREIEEGQAVELNLPGEFNLSSVVIEYPPHGGDFTPLQIRQDVSHEDIFIDFKDGASRERKMGEVTDRRIYRMIANPELKDKVTGEPFDIHMYPSAVTELNAAGQTVLPPNQEYNVLRVVTHLSDYIGDRKPNAETNAHPWGSNPVTQFGEGACIGTLKRADGKQIFEVIGFVQQLDALKMAPVK